LKKRILVTGGTGFIGYHLCKELKKRNYIVHSISTKKPPKIRFIKGVKYILTDISDLKKTKKNIKKNFYSHVVNLAGYVDHGNKKKTNSSHYIGCKNLFQIFLNSNIKKFIQMGSSGEYGQLKSPHQENFNSKPLTIYNLAKKKSSDFLLKAYKKYKFPVTILRLYLAYGPKQDENRFIPIVAINCLKNKSFELSHCNQYRDFIYVEDVTDIIIKTLNNNKANGEIINVGTGKTFKLKSIVNKIRKLTMGGKPIFGVKNLRRDEISKIYPNITKAKKILNWKPKTPLNRGLIKTIKYYKKNYCLF